MVVESKRGRPGGRRKAFKQIKKSYTTSPMIAEEVMTIADEMGVPESAIVNFALKDWLMNYRKQQHEANRIAPGRLKPISVA